MSTPNGSVEELLVKISADVKGLKKGLDSAGRETKKFKESVDSVDKSIGNFRRQALGTLQGLSGIEGALDAVTGQGKLTAGTISQLTQLLPLMATPAGAVTTAMGALGVGVMKVVESERKLKENRTAVLLAEVKTKAEAAAEGWAAYYKAIEEGLNKTDASHIRSLGEKIGLLDRSGKSFQDRTAELQANNAKLEENNIELEKEIKTWKEAGQTHGWFGKTLAQLEAKLAANNATIKANEATIKGGYTPAIEQLTAGKARLAAQTKELLEAQDKERELNEQLAATLDELAKKRQDEFEARDKKTSDRSAKNEIETVFRVKSEGSENPYTDMLADTERALADLKGEVLAAESLEGPIPPDWIARAESLKSVIALLNAEEKKYAEEQKARMAAQREALEQQKAVMQSVGNAAAGVFEQMAFESEDAGEAVKNALRGIAMDLVRIAIAKIIANAGVTGSNVAARDSTTMGVAAVPIGLAAAAAIAAMAGKIPAFKDGGIVDGTSRSGDKKVIRVNSGEEVLTEDDPRHIRNVGRGVQTSARPSIAPAPPPMVVHLNFSSVLPADEAELREVLRTTIVPALQDLERRRVI